MEMNYLAKLKKNWLPIAIIAILVVVNVVLVQRTLLFNKYGYLINSFEEASKKSYTDSYQCLDFSSDLQKKLQEQGIDSQVSIVEQEGKTDELHAVVSIQIEPQTGKPVNFKNVDTCTNDGEKLVCDKGTIENKNIYIANKIEKD
jgi:hypothetical protein